MTLTVLQWNRAMDNYRTASAVTGNNLITPVTIQNHVVVCTRIAEMVSAAGSDYKPVMLAYDIARRKKWHRATEMGKTCRPELESENIDHDLLKTCVLGNVPQNLLDDTLLMTRDGKIKNPNWNKNTYGGGYKNNDYKNTYDKKQNYGNKDYRSYDEKKGKCNNCGRTGHWAVNCRMPTQKKDVYVRPMDFKKR